MKKKVVLPGEFLSTEEEFAPGENAFDSEGGIFSGSVGFPEMDNKAKEISVRPAVSISVVKPGTVVFGRVSLVKDNSLLVELYPYSEDSRRQVVVPSMAMLPVRCVSQSYVERLKDCFKVGDIVRARVMKVTPDGLDLETNQPDLGVVKAFCSRCRKPLHLFGQNLRCLSCGSSEARKLSDKYSSG